MAQQPNLLNKFIVKIAASGPGSWLFSKILHHIDPAAFRMTGGRRTLTSVLTGLPIVMLTTIGRKSGQPRTLPLLGVRDGENAGVFALIASNCGQQRNPGWYYNLKANPWATCVIDGVSGEYVAREAEGADYERFWRYAVAVYPGFPQYKKRAAGRHIPIMVMTPAAKG